MKAEISLESRADGYVDIVTVEDIADRNCFSYADNEGHNCEMCIYEDGLCLFRECDDHVLELHLKDDAYAKIISSEGKIKIDAKVVAFELNNDILVMHYLIDNEERIIKVKYL